MRRSPWVLPQPLPRSRTAIPSPPLKPFNLSIGLRRRELTPRFDLADILAGQVIDGLLQERPRVAQVTAGTKIAPEADAKHKPIVTQMAGELRHVLGGQL